MLRMISTPARFTPRSRVRCSTTSSSSRSSSVYNRVLPSLREGLIRPSRSYRRSVCGWIWYCSATDEIMYAPFDFPLVMALHLFPDFRPWIFGMKLRQLAQDFLGAFVLHFRSGQRDFHDLISVRALAGVPHAFLPQSELLPVLSSRRNLQQRPPIDGGDFNLGPQS